LHPNHTRQGLDIGPDSIKLFQDALADTKTVVWNGPMGVFEFDAFAKGTIVGVARCVFCPTTPYAYCGGQAAAHFKHAESVGGEKIPRTTDSQALPGQPSK
jgi:3-phosphoglycerate kinase